MGYITVGNKIDPNDWRDSPRPSADQIAQAVIEQLPKGNIVLLHDSGGEREQTVKAIPTIVHELRARGY
jgi:peptidoglycan/xylan/chitin deacetylase (PgdA/CDA1 family)